MDRKGGFSPVGDHPDNVSRTCNKVSTGEDTRDIGLESLRIDGQTVPSRDFETDLFGEKRDVRRLADCRNEEVDINIEFRSVDWDGPSAAILVRFSQPISNTSDAGHFNAIFGEDLNGRGKIIDSDSLLLHLI